MPWLKLLPEALFFLTNLQGVGMFFAEIPTQLPRSLIHPSGQPAWLA
jgi:hypothetical protein